MKKERHVLLFVASIILVSIITGFIYGINNDLNIDSYIEALNEHNILYISDFIIIITFLFATISLIGIIINTFILGIEGVSIGYIMALFYNHYSIKGIIYSMISILINKGFLIMILIYLFITGYIYIKKCIRNIMGLNNDYLKHLLVPLLKKYGVIIIGIILYDTFIYFLGNMFLNYLTFML